MGKVIGMESQSSQKIREAMERLLDEKGTPSFKPLTVTQLAKEAGVSRGSIYNNRELLEEWNLRAQSHKLRNNSEQAFTDLQILKEKYSQLSRTNAELRREIKAAATVIAELSARLQAVHTGTVHQLRSNRPVENMK